MPVINPHEWLDQSILSLFSHEHIWLHVVGHIVLIVMPVILLILLIRWLYLLGYWVTQINIAHFRAVNTNSSLELPQNLMGFILKYSGRSQLLLAFLAFSILPITYAQLELPKRIINGAIGTENNDASAWIFTQGLTQVDSLLVLCGLFLTTLMASAVLKYVLNIKIGSAAEGLLRRIRLIIVRNSSGRPKNMDQKSIVPIVTQEVEPICSFSGDAIIVPVLQGGTVITIITFMMAQNIILGAAAITLLPIQLLIIPRLQRRVNLYVKQRIGVIRTLSNSLQATDQLKGRSHIRGQIRNLHAYSQVIFTALDSDKN